LTSAHIVSEPAISSNAPLPAVVGPGAPLGGTPAHRHTTGSQWIDDDIYGSDQPTVGDRPCHQHGPGASIRPKPRVGSSGPGRSRRPGSPGWLGEFVSRGSWLRSIMGACPRPRDAATLIVRPSRSLNLMTRDSPQSAGALARSVAHRHAQSR